MQDKAELILRSKKLEQIPFLQGGKKVTETVLEESTQAQNIAGVVGQAQNQQVLGDTCLAQGELLGSKVPHNRMQALKERKRDEQVNRSYNIESSEETNNVPIQQKQQLENYPQTVLEGQTRSSAQQASSQQSKNIVQHIHKLSFNITDSTVLRQTVRRNKQFLLSGAKAHSNSLYSESTFESQISDEIPEIREAWLVQVKNIKKFVASLTKRGVLLTREAQTAKNTPTVIATTSQTNFSPSNAAKNLQWPARAKNCVCTHQLLKSITSETATLQRIIIPTSRQKNNSETGQRFKKVLKYYFDSAQEVLDFCNTQQQGTVPILQSAPDTPIYSYLYDCELSAVEDKLSQIARDGNSTLLIATVLPLDLNAGGAESESLPSRMHKQRSPKFLTDTRAKDTLSSPVCRTRDSILKNKNSRFSTLTEKSIGSAQQFSPRLQTLPPQGQPKKLFDFAACTNQSFVMGAEGAVRQHFRGSSNSDTYALRRQHPQNHPSPRRYFSPACSPKNIQLSIAFKQTERNIVHLRTPLLLQDQDFASRQLHLFMKHFQINSVRALAECLYYDAFWNQSREELDAIFAEFLLLAEISTRFLQRKIPEEFALVEQRKRIHALFGKIMYIDIAVLKDYYPFLRRLSKTVLRAVVRSISQKSKIPRSSDILQQTLNQQKIDPFSAEQVDAQESTLQFAAVDVDIDDDKNSNNNNNTLSSRQLQNYAQQAPLTQQLDVSQQAIDACERQSSEHCCASQLEQHNDLTLQLYWSDFLRFRAFFIDQKWSKEEKMYFIMQVLNPHSHAKISLQTIQVALAECLRKKGILAQRFFYQLSREHVDAQGRTLSCRVLDILQKEMFISLSEIVNVLLFANNSKTQQKQQSGKVARKKNLQGAAE